MCPKEFNEMLTLRSTSRAGNGVAVFLRRHLESAHDFLLIGSRE